MAGSKTRKKSWAERSRLERTAIGLLASVALTLVAIAERDLQRRPADEVRGSKAPWRIVSLNGLGAAAYLFWGRRPSPR